MKKNLFLYALALCITTCAFSQDPAIQWQNTIGGEHHESMYDMTPTSDGGYLLGGTSRSDAGADKSEDNIGNDYTTDFWIVKVDNELNIEWENTIGGIYDDELDVVLQTPDGGYFLAGSSSSNISGDKTDPVVGPDIYPDYWVVKTNATGVIEWQNALGGTIWDFFTSAELTSGGGYILGGYSKSNAGGDKSENSLGEYDYWIVKLNSLGTLQWENTIGGSGSDYLQCIKQTPDGGYIAGGYSKSEISGDKTEGVIGGGAPEYDYWVVKLNATGGITWQNTIGGVDDDYLMDILVTPDGGYLLGGTSESPASFDKSEGMVGGITGYKDFWIVKLNAAGGVVWDNTIGGNGYDELAHMEFSADDNYLLGGYSASGISGDKNEIGYGSSDYWMVKVDLSGNILNQYAIGGDRGDDMVSFTQTADNGYVMAGTSNSSIAFDKTEDVIGGNFAMSDYWIVKISAGDCIPMMEICNTLDDDCNGIADDAVVETISISAGGATTFCQGGNVVLTATASGTSVQWRKNGNPIPGATSIIYTATKSGTYTCETSSACDMELSNSIVVTVNKNPPASISAGGATTFCAGGSVTLNEIPVVGSTYQWYKGASAIAGATTTSYVATTAGTYKCRVTKTATGCFKNSNAIIVTVPCRENETITNNSITDNSFTIYPNPNNGTFTITWNGSPLERGRPARSDQSDGGVSVEIYNAIGQLIFSKQIELETEVNETINLGNISAGIYIIRIDDGVSLSEQKLIIE